MIYTKPGESSKKFFQNSATVDQIEQHSDLVRKNLSNCNLTYCPRCKLLSDFFKRHDKRKRKFYVIIDDIIKVVTGLLTRWKCSGCDKSFTGYPGFAIPYKRYTLPTLFDFSSKYVDDDKMTYEHLIKLKAVGYPGADAHKKGKQLDKSTIHRWISTIGNYAEIIRKGQSLIMQSNPGSSICRDLANFKVAPHKHTTESRKKVLLQCLKLLALEIDYNFTFGQSIFPKLATSCAFH